MSESDEKDEKRQVAEPTISQPVKPAQRFVVQMNSVSERARRQLHGSMKERYRTPHNQDDHHDRGHGHDLQRLRTGFVYSLDVLQPEVGCDPDPENRGKGVVRKMPQGVMQVIRDIVDETGKVLASDNRAQRAGQNVVEK